MTIVITAYVISSILAVIWPQSRAWRLLVAVFLLQYLAYDFSFGKISHSSHMMLFLSWFWVLIPSMKEPSTRTKLWERQFLLMILFYAQATVALFYTLSGSWKLILGFFFDPTYAVHALSIESMSYTIADRLMTLKPQSTLLGPTIIENPWMGWLFMVSVIYFQVFAFVIAFRPKLHRLLGLSILLFHIGSIFTLGINFHSNIFCAGLIFVMSPFCTQGSSWKEILLELPIIKGLRLWVFKSKSNARVKPKVS